MNTCARTGIMVAAAKAQMAGFGGTGGFGERSK